VIQERKCTGVRRRLEEIPSLSHTGPSAGKNTGKSGTLDEKPKKVRRNCSQKTEKGTCKNNGELVY